MNGPNIDTEFMTKRKFIRLAMHYGDQEKALGHVVSAWLIGFDYFRKGQLIPEEEFVAEGFGDLIEFGFAVKKTEGVYLKGSRENWKWYKQRKEAGKKGGEAKRDKAKKKKELAAAKVRLAKASDSLAKSSSVSVSVSVSKDSSYRDTSPDAQCSADNVVSFPEKSEPARKKVPSTDGAFVWEAYKAAYKSVYNTEPLPNAKVRTQCKRLVETVGKDLAVSLADFFPRTTDSWLKERCHPFDALVSDPNRWNVRRERGQFDPPQTEKHGFAKQEPNIQRTRV